MILFAPVDLNGLIASVNLHPKIDHVKRCWAYKLRLSTPVNHEFQIIEEILNCKTLGCLVIVLNPLLLLYYVIQYNTIIVNVMCAYFPLTRQNYNATMQTVCMII